jgi:hypothetical protein
MPWGHIFAVASIFTGAGILISFGAFVGENIEEALGVPFGPRSRASHRALRSRPKASIADARETKPATESQVGRGEHRAAQLASSRQQITSPRTGQGSL